MAKQSFLLFRAHRFELQDVQSFYDAEQHLNVVSESGRIYPLVDRDDFGRTGSKTYAMPGDDDPDPEDEGCY